MSLLVIFDDGQHFEDVWTAEKLDLLAHVLVQLFHFIGTIQILISFHILQELHYLIIQGEVIEF